MTNHRALIVQAAYGSRFGIIPKDNDNCQGDEHLMPEISEDGKAAAIENIESSLRTDPGVWDDMTAHMKEHKDFVAILQMLDEDMLYAAYWLRKARDGVFKELAEKEYERSVSRGLRHEKI